MHPGPPSNLHPGLLLRWPGPYLTAVSPGCLAREPLAGSCPVLQFQKMNEREAVEGGRLAFPSMQWGLGAVQSLP